ncbi:MAG: methyltransferase domain-containing protein [Oscillospiraceae bacterium]|jgi:trans-aconitate 2-methyltransferase|nr:methyltransferase domain-containing protein [Oscillospiraceae bacterium]
MSSWNPHLYLSFAKERTQPSIDLVARIDMESPKRILDVGCGPGNSTAILKSRWPNAEITGLDYAQSMIEQAKQTDSAIKWVHGDATSDLAGLGTFNIVFSNAAIQWMPNQPLLLKNLHQLLMDGGVLAVQVPCVKDMPIHTELQNLIAEPKWKSHFAALSSAHSVHSAEYYYGVLCGLTSNVALWVTAYYHVMPSHHSLIEWYSGSALRPYFDCFAEERLKADFLQDYENRLKNCYPLQSDGKILFPFKRIFFILKK